MGGGKGSAAVMRPSGLGEGPEPWVVSARSSSRRDRVDERGLIRLHRCAIASNLTNNRAVDATSAADLEATTTIALSGWARN